MFAADSVYDAVVSNCGNAVWGSTCCDENKRVLCRYVFVHALAWVSSLLCGVSDRAAAL